MRPDPTATRTSRPDSHPAQGSPAREVSPLEPPRPIRWFFTTSEHRDSWPPITPEEAQDDA